MTDLGGRVRRTARLAQLSARMGAGLLAARRDERRGDEAATAAHHAQVAEAMLDTLGTMKGAAMKVGQMLSFVDLDVDPRTSEEYRRRLESLQDTAPPSDPDVVAGVVADEFGAPVEAVFARWDPEPLAVASIGQVHRARLHDGSEVAVKVQHPGIAEAVEADLANLDRFAALARLANPQLDAAPLLAEVRERIGGELDYQQEAAFQQAFVDRYAGHPFIRVPRVHHDHCRPRVLVTEHVAGARFGEVAATASQADRDRYGEIIFRFVFGSLYRFRIFNADPHPGNYLFPGDGSVVFLDFGCTKAFSTVTRERLRAVHRAVMADDPAALLPALRGAGIAPQAGAVDVPKVLEWFRLAHEPMNDDAPATYTPDYARRLTAASSDPRSEYAPALRSLAMPADYLMLNRISFGVNSLLARLEPTANWQRVMREFCDATPPSSPLGEAEAAWLTASGYTD
jgi:predicted unusual protein kinase regulating ubiquinone biosynthesis (AarF/ABC1/UbiB family)